MSDNYVPRWWVKFDDELSWLVTKYSELFILLAENNQILLKIYVIQIFLAFIYLVAQSLLLNNQLNSSLRHIIVTMVSRNTIFVCVFYFFLSYISFQSINKHEIINHSRIHQFNLKCCKMSFNRRSLGGLTKMEGTQMEIFNSL